MRKGRYGRRHRASRDGRCTRWPERPASSGAGPGAASSPDSCDTMDLLLRNERESPRRKSAVHRRNHAGRTARPRRPRLAQTCRPRVPCIRNRIAAAGEPAMSPEFIAIIAAAAMILGFLWNLHRDIAGVHRSVDDVRERMARLEGLFDGFHPPRASRAARVARPDLRSAWKSSAAFAPTTVRQGDTW